MNAQKTIMPPPWIQTSASRKLMQVLNQASEDPDALFVGGCVRNTLMNLEVHDIDIATKHRPDQVKVLCEEAGFRVIPTGIKHGTLTAIMGQEHFEITTLRRDLETDGRHACIAFSRDWGEDAARRDFTLNALYMDEQGNIYDPLGSGLKDLEACHVTFVGNADARISEDVLRILRFFRFRALYAKTEADQQELDACKQAAAEIKNLSKERITAELLKIIAAEAAAEALSLMQDYNILQYILCFETDLKTFSLLKKAQQKYGSHDICASLFALSQRRNAEEIIERSRLRLTRKQKTTLYHLQLAYHACSIAAKHLAYRYGKDIALQILMLRGGCVDDIKEIQAWSVPSFPLSGGDLKEIGVLEGKDMGRILQDTEAWWMESDFVQDRHACLQYAQTLLG